MTDADLKQYALDYVAGKVYTSQDVPQDLWKLVFMPVFFMQRRQLRGVRMVLARIGDDTTSGQAVNGYPIFFSCRTLKARDTRKFVTFVEEARKLTANFLGGRT